MAKLSSINKNERRKQLVKKYAGRYAKLKAIAAERQDDKLFLRADGAIPYERVVQVMGALNSGGFANIVLVTDAGGPTFGGQGAPGQDQAGN